MSKSVLDKLRLRSSLDDLKSSNMYQSLLAEFVGTFILVFIGLGSLYGKEFILLNAAFAFGFGGAVGIYASSPISGGHINPAVSFGLLIARKISLIRFVFYCIVQLVGSIIAALIMEQLTGNKYPEVQGSSIAVVTPARAIGCEVILTFVLVFTVCRMAIEKDRTESEKGMAALMIGISIFVCVLCGANISGAGMNPARTLGPAIVYNYYKNVWIFIVGPMIGGALAGLLQQLAFTSELSRCHIKSYLMDSDFDRKEGEDNKGYAKSTEDIEISSH